MLNAEPYNGWTNRETWLANLWLNETLLVDQESSLEITAEYVRELVEDMVDGDMFEHGFARDLFICALAKINYREIAEHYPQEDTDDA